MAMFKRASQIIDAHTHFFSHTWFSQFLNATADRFPGEDGLQRLADSLGWELPSRSPRDLGARWVEEQDKYGISRQVLFASKLNDAEQLAVAIQAFPDRLIGYVLIDPNQEASRQQTHYSLHILGMKGILMFPALHHFHAYNSGVFTIYQEAAAAELPVFLHFGKFEIPIFRKLGLPDNVDLAYSDPLDLMIPAKEFPDVNFIIPHFGCGRFEAALEVATECENVYFDTSSSNSWIEPPLTLTDVFKRSLEVLGPRRLLFGTDSSHFPRGWRQDISAEQERILRTQGVPSSDRDLIFGGNIARILHLG